MGGERKKNGRESGWQPDKVKCGIMGAFSAEEMETEMGEEGGLGAKRVR